MAVHLNARLNTRFIPYLMGSVAFVILVSALAHAGDASIVAGDLPVSRGEIQVVMGDSREPARLDRRPGFSRIIVAPRPGEHPTTKEPTSYEEAGSLMGSTDAYLSDELPAQPVEAPSD